MGHFLEMNGVNANGQALNFDSGYLCCIITDIHKWPPYDPY